MKPPEWGPAAVAAVPAKIVSAPSGISPRTDHTPTRSFDVGRDPGSYVARHASANAATRISSERLKCAITNPGARWFRTVKPPSTACATTPSGSSSARIARSRRYGRRVNASTAATTVISPTIPDTARLPNSISAWELSGGSGVPPHFGQFSQPSPESVSRTAAPVITISVSDASVA